MLLMFPNDDGAMFAADVTRRVRIDAPGGTWTSAGLTGVESFGSVTGATVTLPSREMV
jgi:hypothetical protein